MKISEALLYVVRESGGQISHTQLQEWVGQLIKTGYLERQLQENDGQRRPYYVITLKGRDTLARKGL